MRPLARVLIDESHRQAWTTRPEVAAIMNPVNPADASMASARTVIERAGMEVRLHTEGAIDDAALAGVDVLVLPHASDDAWERTTGVGSPCLARDELDAIERFVLAGGGLVVLAETEQAKYGNNVAELAMRFGIAIDSSTVQDPRHAYRGVPTWVLADLIRGPQHDLTARVAQACFYRAGTLHAVAGTAAAGLTTVARTSIDADPAGAGLVMTSTLAGGRVVVTSDSDLFGDDSIDDLDHRHLWENLITWAAGSRAAARREAGSEEPWTTTDEAWLLLAATVTALRELQEPDGAIAATADTAEAARQVVQACRAIEALTPRFAHQAEHLGQTVADLRAWAAGGFGVPDFARSLERFRPDLHRVDGVEHLAVFPMSTQNGNPSRNLEAVVTRTFWPNWLAEIERTYDNAAFVPIEFVGFTAGYQTHSAVFFPETVAASRVIDFHWGGIFCDREAARFRCVVREASRALRLSLPPDVDLLLDEQRLARDAFVLWDLIHDRAHSRGDLPFDPFMIKQRMPYWMYALEELRCDLSTYRETLALDASGIHLGRYIRYAIVFDRLFRFTITGDRIRNYDGLGGQIIFAWLHRDEVLRWADNTLTVDWARLDDSMIALCTAVQSLYRDGIDRSRISQWIAGHEFIRGLVQPSPASVWAKGVSALPLDGEPRKLVDIVLPDEFPLNVFYERLRHQLAPTIIATAGITA